MRKENRDFLEKYLNEAKRTTDIGEHLFATNILLNEIAKNTAPEIINIGNAKKKENN